VYLIAIKIAEIYRNREKTEPDKLAELAGKLMRISKL
jgi:hypothetical protein